MLFHSLPFPRCLLLLASFSLLSFIFSFQSLVFLTSLFFACVPSSTFLGLSLGGLPVPFPCFFLLMAFFSLYSFISLFELLLLPFLSSLFVCPLASSLHVLFFTSLPYHYPFPSSFCSWLDLFFSSLILAFRPPSSLCVCPWVSSLHFPFFLFSYATIFSPHFLLSSA